MRSYYTQCRTCGADVEVEYRIAGAARPATYLDPPEPAEVEFLAISADCEHDQDEDAIETELREDPDALEPPEREYELEYEPDC